MGPEETNDDKLYSVNGVVWSGLQSFTLKTLDEPEVIDHYCEYLPFIKGSISFAFKDPYISRKLLRPVRRWSRKKVQQKKRRLAKEKKYGLLHEET